jgi:hypothetical protein
MLSMLGKDDAHRLLQKLYGNHVCVQCARESIAPEPVQSITSAAQLAVMMGRDMTPVLIMLRHLSATRRASPEATERLVLGGHS